MRVVPKYYINVPLQLLLYQKPKMLSSNYHLIAHWSSWWLNPELQRKKGTEIKIKCLELKSLSFAPYKTFGGMFEPYDGTTLIS